MKTKLQILGYWLVMLALFALACRLSPAQVNEWHSLTPHLTASQKQSASYKFLVSKFGAGNLLMECDVEEAALLGDEYLFQVMSYSDESHVGETRGTGSTLQGALDNAAAKYISPTQVKMLRHMHEQDEKDRQRREAEYRKKCCVEGGKP